MSTTGGENLARHIRQVQGEKHQRFIRAMSLHMMASMPRWRSFESFEASVGESFAIARRAVYLEDEAAASAIEDAERTVAAWEKELVLSDGGVEQ